MAVGEGVLVGVGVFVAVGEGVLVGAGVGVHVGSHGQTHSSKPVVSLYS